MIKLKWNRYVELINGDKSDLVYNWKNTQVYMLPRNTTAKIEEYLIKRECANEEIKTIITQLYLEKVLIGEDDVESHCSQNIEGKEKGKTGAVYFMPSMKCNFRCPYCFVGTEVNKLDGRLMSEFIIDNAADFISKEVKENSINDLRVLLFGGEPTLNIDKHFIFMKKLNSKVNIRIQYVLVTNGWYMPFEEIDEMIEEGLETIQITLDGPRKIHNQRRKLRNGRGTYDKIIANVIKLKDKNIKLAIRVNVARNNIDYIGQLIDDLVSIELVDRIVFQIVPVDPSDFSKESGYDAEVLEKFADVYKKAVKNKIAIVNWNRGCSVRSKLFFAIDPKGDLYKCPDYVGERNACIGNVLTGYNAKYYDYINLSIDKECINCKEYNLCRGGCQYLRDIQASKNAYCIKDALKKVNKSYLLAKYDKEYSELRANNIGKILSKMNK